jgi:hypothetical protein
MTAQTPTVKAARAANITAFVVVIVILRLDTA